MKNGFTLDQCILLDWLFPRRCVFCAAKLDDGWWCAPCARDLPWIATRCLRCGTPLSSDRICGQCQKRMPMFDRTVAPLTYEAPIDRSIQQFKYRRQLSLTEPLSELFVSKAHFAGPMPQILLPVPLHAARLRRRGYNQALELARAIGKRVGVPINSGLVIRARATAVQAELPLAQRQSNVRGVFSLRQPLACTRIAIVDDVMTSGATINELARVLRHAGAKWVEAWCIARA